MNLKEARELIDFFEKFPKIAANIKEVYFEFEPRDGNEKRKIETLIAQWEASRK